MHLQTSLSFLVLLRRPSHLKPCILRCWSGVHWDAVISMWSGSGGSGAILHQSDLQGPPSYCSNSCCCSSSCCSSFSTLSFPVILLLPFYYPSSPASPCCCPCCSCCSCCCCCCCCYFKVGGGRDLKSKYIKCKRRDGDVQSRGGAGEPPHSPERGGGSPPALLPMPMHDT